MFPQACASSRICSNLPCGLIRSGILLATTWVWRRKREESLRYNKRATQLNPENEAAWWNLGIAATALRDWAEARRAWEAYGVKLLSGSGEVTIKPVVGCVRLNPNHEGEVVWAIA